MDQVFVRDLMTEHVIFVQPTDNLEKTYDLMRSHAVDHLPVLDEDGDLVGLVSHRDMVRSALSALDEWDEIEKRNQLQHMVVKEVMNCYVESITSDMDICQAGEIMLENKFDCLPVVEGSQIVGILTDADFIKFIINRLNQSEEQETSL